MLKIKRKYGSANFFEKGGFTNSKIIYVRVYFLMFYRTIATYRINYYGEIEKLNAS